MPQAVTITSLPSAFEYVKEMNMLVDTQWDGDYRSATRSALTRILHDRMSVSVDYHLAEMGRLDISDQMILSCFVLGLSTRKVSEALLPILGEPYCWNTRCRGDGLSSAPLSR